MALIFSEMNVLKDIFKIPETLVYVHANSKHAKYFNGSCSRQVLRQLVLNVTTIIVYH